MMKKISFCIVSLLLLVSCNTERGIDTNFLEKKYDSNTQSLDLSGLDLITIPDFSEFGTGATFNNLKSIDLSGNSIESLDINKLNYFENLRDIDLSDNKIIRIRNLDIDADILDLSNNQIETISFQDGALLRDLNLTNNNLVFGSDMKLPSIIWKLELSGNRLQNIDGLGKLTELLYLDLWANKLRDTNLSELRGRNHIQYMNLSENPEISTARAEILEEFNNAYLDKIAEQDRVREALRKPLD